MRSNQYRSSPASIYMLSVTDFDPKGTISEVRVHAGLYLDILDADRSPHAADTPQSSPGRLIIYIITMAKLKKKLLKIVSKNEDKLERPWRSVRKIHEYVIATNDFHWMNAGDVDGAQYLSGGEVERVTTEQSHRLRMRGCLYEICKREVSNVRNVRQREEVWHSHKNSLCVLSYCANRWGEGTSNNCL